MSSFLSLQNEIQIDELVKSLKYLLSLDGRVVPLLRGQGED